MGGVDYAPPKSSFSRFIRRRSPDEFGADLANARILGLRDIAEGAVVVSARILELRMVEYVEEFPANLEGHGFPNGKYLRYPEVGVVEARSVKESTIRRAESAAVRTRSGAGEKAVRWGERALAKIRVRASAFGSARVRDVNRSHQIGHIGGGTAGER
jgi:hypothetical protein